MMESPQHLRIPNRPDRYPQIEISRFQVAIRIREEIRIGIQQLKKNKGKNRYPQPQKQVVSIAPDLYDTPEKRGAGR